MIENFKSRNGKEHTVIFKGDPIRLSADFSVESIGQKEMARYIESAERKKPCKPRILYPAR